MVPNHAWGLAMILLPGCHSNFIGSGDTGPGGSTSGDPTSVATDPATGGGSLSATSSSGPVGTTTDSGGTDSTGSTGSTLGGTTTGSATSSGSETSAGNRAPEIVDFSATATQITDGQSVVFTALVTDPDGVDDVIGGQLTSEDGSRFLGSFTAVGSGSFTLDLTWEKIHQTEPIDVEGETRTFRAEFFDTQAATDSTFAALTLSCETLSLCSGSCLNLQEDGLNCGGCEHACIDTAAGCVAGACAPAFRPCFEVVPPMGRECGRICGDLGESCVAQGCNGATYIKDTTEAACNGGSPVATGTPACNEPVYNFGAGWYGCCCTDTP